MMKLTHTNQEGKANMVDVSNKAPLFREAIAEGFIRLQPETVRLIRENQMKKGDVLTVSEIAGIQAAKKTSELIPLCHPLQLTKVSVRATLKEEGVEVVCQAKCKGETGVEMEALTGVQLALLTLYDMCKAVDKRMIIENVHLIEKSKKPLEDANI
ncbi:MAG: cyclic pyranopterin monophosphate synthase MoaC [Bacteroidales bacterium]|nr:cyclic pyranopterin monophosphate synthase MoaC [Bacteroidales bacterium]